MKKRIAVFLATILSAGLMIGAFAAPAAAHNLWDCPGASGVKIYTGTGQSPSSSAQVLCHLNPLEIMGDFTHGDNHLGTNNVFAHPYDIVSSHMNNNAESYKILDRNDGCDTTVKFFDDKAYGWPKWQITLLDSNKDYVNAMNFPSDMRNKITSIKIIKDC